MNITLTGVAETITAFGGFVTGVGTIVLQIIAAHGRNKIGRQVAENTELTRATASKVDEVHAVQVATTGTYQTLKEPPP